LVGEVFSFALARAACAGPMMDGGYPENIRISAARRQAADFPKAIL